MESLPVENLPAGGEWLFEPKWDGFRSIAFRQRSTVRLQSRNQKSLDRFFPELIDALRVLPVERFVLDGEIVIRGQPFETLQLRLHPAGARIAQLANDHPATFVAFDLLADAEGRSLLKQPFSDRRSALEQFFKKTGKSYRLILSRATRSRAQAMKLLRADGHGFEGIMAKPLGEPYRPGRRVMLKLKRRQTLDCVVAGYYADENTGIANSLLLGLYDQHGKLHYVGHARIGRETNRVMDLLRQLEGGPGFTGAEPAERNRWSGKKRNVVPLRPRLVADVSAAHVTEEGFRHSARILRFREDKKPEACTLDQLSPLKSAKQ
jgi:ATP-dependent DNA ligase